MGETAPSGGRTCSAYSPDNIANEAKDKPRSAADAANAKSLAAGVEEKKEAVLLLQWMHPVSSPGKEHVGHVYVFYDFWTAVIMSSASPPLPEGFARRLDHDLKILLGRLRQQPT